MQGSYHAPKTTNQVTGSVETARVTGLEDQPLTVPKGPTRRKMPCLNQAYRQPASVAAASHEPQRETSRYLQTRRTRMLICLQRIEMCIKINCNKSDF